MDSYLIASWVVSKTLALTYFIAFLSLSTQVLGLFGSRGILSIDHLLNILDKELGVSRFRHFPSVFWFESSDFSLKAACLIGMLASTLAFLGFSQTWMFVVCWMLYLSFASCGQIFLSYQWDNLLLELGFIALFFAPFSVEWIPFKSYEIHPMILGLVWLLLVKLMFSSGIVKLTNKDPDWKNLSALRFHYWTQPLPNPLAWFLSKAPLAFQKFSCGLLFFIEIVSPVFLLFGGKAAFVAALLQILLQALIILTGNFAFFNILTLGLCFSVIADTFWTFHDTSWVLPVGVSTELAVAVFVVLLPGNLFWIYKTVFEKSKALDFMLPWMRFLFPFRITNPYGLFAVMTKSRPEIVLEGSNDGQTWLEYEFKHKPTKLTDRPTIVAPFQPRLDWQMWFAALEGYSENMWLQNLVTRLFDESPDVQELLKKDPFQGKSPKLMRFVRYDYHFSTWQNLKTKGEWWKREHSSAYSPIFERDEES
ncbi:lipase maturation factor family protein [Bdellovibrio sp. SKB1291214]|uniref:lipase maturation factor family protein n=1 Tax=Bdellovibrio sp. SKB1291214 TaxID=1732569 RepID=UPI0020CEC5F5|nr:lipase maturation factor family protein [Bdellovibrio sp. SKB1291214]UYL09550.1 lipase maturation factor family protein [Bdellovibrio sp. SKB1291214]